MLRLPILLTAAVLALGSPPASAQEVRTREFTVADGSVVKVAWTLGGPLPVENDAYVVTNAGFGVPRPKTRTAALTQKWIFDIALKSDVKLDSITVEEVWPAKLPVLYLRDDAPDTARQRWNGITAELPATQEAAPWLYRDDNTVFIFKFTVTPHGQPPVVAYQAAVESPALKQGTVSRALKHQQTLP